MKQILKNDWNELLKDEFSKEYYLTLREFLKNEYNTKTIYPDKYDIFNALHYTSYEDVKVVCLLYTSPGRRQPLYISLRFSRDLCFC